MIITPSTDAAGNILSRQAVLAGASPFSVVIPAGTGTGFYAAGVFPLSAVYQGIIANVIGSSSVSGGAVQLYGSLDGNSTNSYPISAAITVPTSATATPFQAHPTAGQNTTSTDITACAFVHIKVTTAIAGAAATVELGAY